MDHEDGEDQSMIYYNAPSRKRPQLISVFPHSYCNAQTGAFAPYVVRNKLVVYPCVLAQCAFIRTENSIVADNINCTVYTFQIKSEFLFLAPL